MQWVNGHQRASFLVTNVTGRKCPSLSECLVYVAVITQMQIHILSNLDAYFVAENAVLYGHSNYDRRRERL